MWIGGSPMIFRQWRQVLDGNKTQTRRLRFPWELAIQLWKYGWSLQKPYAPYTWADWQNEITAEHIIEANRILTEQHITLPIKPHRTAKANGRICPIQIRKESLQDITPRDAIAEGIERVLDKGGGPLHPTTAYKDYRDEPVKYGGLGAVASFGTLWDSIHKKLEDRFAGNPEVWVKEFEVAR